MRLLLYIRNASGALESFRARIGVRCLRGAGDRYHCPLPIALEESGEMRRAFVKPSTCLLALPPDPASGAPPCGFMR